MTITIPPLSPFPGRGAAPEDYIAQADTTMQQLPGVVEGIRQAVDAFNLGAGVLAGGYLPPVSYAAGISVTLALQTVQRGGVTYAPLIERLPFVTGADFDATAWRVVQGVTASALADTSGAGLIGWIQSGAGAVFRWIRDKLRETVSVKDFGAVSDGVTNDAAAVALANAAAGQQPLKFVGVTHIATEVTITAPLVDTMQQIFSTTSVVKIDNGMPLRPEWFGDISHQATMARAVAALPLGGGVIQFERRRYKSSFDTEAAHLTKTNVRFQGRQIPSVSTDDSRQERGTVIEGPLAVFADFFSAAGLGVDAGSYVCDTYYGGIGQEGFWIANLASHPVATRPFLGLQIEGMSVLCKRGYIGHSFLCEYVDGAYINNIKTRLGSDGPVFKTINSNVSNIWAEDHPVNGTIIKSDSYADCSYTNFSNLTITSRVRGYGAGLTLIAATRSMGHMRFINTRIDNTSYGLDAAAAPTYTLEQVEFQNIEVTNSLTTGVNIRDNVNGMKLRGIVANNNGQQGVYAQATSKNVTIEDALASANGTVGAPASGFDMRGIGGRLIRARTELNSGSGLYVNNPQRAIDCHFGGNTGADIVYGATGRLLGAEFQFDVVNLVLLNGWVAQSAGVVPRFWVENGRVFLSGLLTGGALGTTIFTLAPHHRPLRVMRLDVGCFDGTTTVMGQLLIDPSNGAVSLAYGATNYFTLDSVDFSLEGN